MRAYWSLAGLVIACGAPAPVELPATRARAAADAGPHNPLEAKTAPPRVFSVADLRDGDVVFQTSMSNQSKAIQAATRSEYSHMGIVYVDNGEAGVYEASSTVTLTPFPAWAKRGRDRRVVVKRLEDSSALTPAALVEMKAAGRNFANRPYDLTFEWSDDRIYCSELVYKIYRRGAGIELGTLARFRDFDLTHPAVARKLRQRFGSHLPLDELVISPQSMFDEPKLALVFDGTLAGRELVVRRRPSE